jgi:antirestriction protein ArdC
VQTKGLSTLAALRCKPWAIPLPLQLLPPQAWAWAKALLCEQQQHGHSKAKPKEEIPMSSAAVTVNNPVQSSTYQPKQQQRQTAKEVIAENVKALIAQLEAGKSDALTAYLDAMARFHNYSFGNILAIARQKPTATNVAGMFTWNQLGRRVKKGEKGIQILAPMIGTRRKMQEEAEQDGAGKSAPVLVGFRAVYVFDVSQTEGAELPAPATVTGEAGTHLDRLIDFVTQQGIELEYNERIAPAQGASYGGKIVLLPGQSKAETFATLVHELGHEMLHKADRRTATTKVVRETEAEAIAFIVGKAIGLQTGTASADYIQLYHGNAALLAESLEVIQRTSAVILGALEEPSPEDSHAQTAETATPTATEDAAPEPRRSRRTRNEAATTEAAA